MNTLSIPPIPRGKPIGYDSQYKALMAVVGVLVALGGVISVFTGLAGFLLKLLLILITQSAGPNSTVASALSLSSAQDRLLWVNAMMYVPAGIGIIVLGIGIVRCRRWARVLLESFAALMTLLGLVGMIASFFISGLISEVMLGLFSASAAPGVSSSPNLYFETARFMMMGLTLMSGFFYVGIPAALWWFARRPATRAICEAWDKEESWFERCPNLAISLVMVNLTCLFLLPPFYVLKPEFVDGAIYYTVLSVLFIGLALAAYGLLRLEFWGWLLNFIIMVCLGVGASWFLIVYGSRPIVDWYLELVLSGIRLEFPTQEDFYKKATLYFHLVVWLSVFPLLFAQIWVAGRYWGLKNTASSRSNI